MTSPIWLQPKVKLYVLGRAGSLRCRANPLPIGRHRRTEYRPVPPGSAVSPRNAGTNRAWLTPLVNRVPGFWQKASPHSIVWSDTGQHHRPTSCHSVSLEPPVCLSTLQGMIPIWKKTFQTGKVSFSGSVDAFAFERHFFYAEQFRFVSLKIVSCFTQGSPNNRDQLTGNCVLQTDPGIFQSHRPNRPSEAMRASQRA
jgi:hypothetical protein